jgi:molybdopterin molybdotransferase
MKGFSNRIKLREAINLCLNSLNRFSVEEVKLKNTSLSKRILAENIYAKRSIPPFDRSCMDGYAVMSADTIGASENNPLLLEVIGKLEIGKVSLVSVEPGTCIWIPTGGVMPDGADAVIMVEDTAKIPEGGNNIEIYAGTHPGKNVAPAGEDIENDTLLFRVGRRLKPVDRAFLLSAGVSTIKTSLTPTIAILSTGNEIVEAWSPEIGFGKIPDVNSINLYELCKEEEWKPQIKGIIFDDESALKKAIQQAATECNVVLISGGSSVGEKDFIPSILNELGNLVFHGIAMRPGGPVCAAQIDKSIAFGLPGFPSATIIAFQFIVRPVILSLMGIDQEYSPLTVQVKVVRNVGSTLGRLEFLRVRIKKGKSGELLAIPIQIGGSGILRSIVDGNGIIPIVESSEGLKKDDIVEAIIIGSNFVDFK